VPDGLRGGIDLGGTKIQAVVVDARGAVRGEFREPTPNRGGPADVVNALATAMRGACEAAGVQSSQLDGVGVGSPGAIDAQAGTVSNPPNLPWSDPYPMGPELSRALGTGVLLDNDVRVATRAEYRLGAGRPYRSVLGVFWGTGVGGGVVINGEMWQGRGAAGEIGHTMVREGGALCRCGHRGHLEAYAGRASMEERALRMVKRGVKSALPSIQHQRSRDRMTSSVWAKALEQDDKLAHHLIDRAVWALGVGIASAMSLLDVEAVIIGGGLGLRLGEEYVRRIEAHMRPELFVAERPPAMHLASLGDLGGATGAALLVEQSARAHRGAGRQPAR
jgi:glucokinase